MALANILEYAKACRDLSTDSPASRESFACIVGMAYEALGKPSLADIEKIMLAKPQESR
jgi:hypothetical protein